MEIQHEGHAGIFDLLSQFLHVVEILADARGSRGIHEQSHADDVESGIVAQEFQQFAVFNLGAVHVVVGHVGFFVFREHGEVASSIFCLGTSADGCKSEDAGE